MKFGDRLFELRKQQNLSQKDLAQKIDFSQSSINYWEKGQRTPSIEAVRIIADYFNVTPNYLLYGNERKHISGIPEGKVKLNIDGNIMYVDPIEFIRTFNNVADLAHPSHLSTLINEFFKLNIKGQKKAVEQLKLLAKIPDYIENNPQKSTLTFQDVEKSTDETLEE